MGTCSTMCPAAEVKDRMKSKNFTRLEVGSGNTERPEFPMKVFVRTMTGNAEATQEEDIGNVGPDWYRTQAALVQTMVHLRAWLDGAWCDSVFFYKMREHASRVACGA